MSKARLEPARLPVWLALVLGGALLLSSPGCGDEAEESPAPTSVRAPQVPVDRVLGRAPFFALTDQAGKPFRSDALLGRVWIADFMFTRCRGTCPVQVARLRELQEDLAEHPRREEIRFVSISVDPETDTPAVLADYAKAYELDLDHWTFLTGEQRDTWLLSTEGFRLPAGADPDNEDMPIAHSANFILVDRRGLIRGLFDSQSAEGVAALREALDRVVAEPAPVRRSLPKEIDGASFLDDRERTQREAAKGWSVRHDFRFTDRLRESGIRFQNRIVDDGGRSYLAVHYDHGNGIAVADVDGDGRLDVYFSNQVGSNQLWRNLGGGRFENITREAGVAVKDAIGVTASFADTDNDGDPDLFVTTVRGGNRFFENDGHGRFQDVSRRAGLDHVGHSSAGIFFDYDRDGLLDLFVCNIGVYTDDDPVPVINDGTTAGLEPGEFLYFRGVKDAFAGHLKPERNEESLLYRNLGGNRFREVHEIVSLKDISWTGDASPIDLNEDGWVDLYVLNMQGHDEYYENVKGKHFVRRSRELFPRTSWGAMGIKVFDYDIDGDLDIYITDMHSDMSQVVPPDAEKQKAEMRWPEAMLRSGGKSIWGNTFFEQVEKGRFEEVSDRLGVENFWPWGLSVADINADGFEDVFVTCSMNYLFRYQTNNLLLNLAGKRFADSEFVLGLEPRSGPRTKPWFDLDGSKPYDRKHALGKGVDGPVEVWAPRGSRASVVFDLDADGDLDIVTNEFNAKPQVLVSDLAQRGGLHYLQVALQGSRSNRDGLGATVRLTAGGRTFLRQHDGKSGYLSQSTMPLYFGLGDAASVSRIEVRWPSGTMQTVTKDIPIDGLFVIREP